MSLWQDVVTAALVGSDRLSPTLPPVEGELGKLLEKLNAAEPEKFLLGAAAAISLHQRAGKVPKRATAKITPCDLEDLPPCSDRAGQYLTRILRGEHPELLYKWLAMAQATSVRVSDAALPELLERGKTQLKLREAMVPVLGKRGCWLAAQNPDWNYIGAIADDSTWESGSREARLWLLQLRRRENPARAREMLAATWIKESAADRAIFLAALETGLSLEDELFLEKALDDRSKPVNRTAADLLARLPESGLCQRMTERFRTLVKVTPGWAPNIEITLPEACDTEMIRDGIDSQPPAGTGAKSWWLQQIIAAVPLEVWCGEETKLPHLIQTAIAREWEPVLLEGWAIATCRQQNIPWAEALLETAIKAKLNLSKFPNLSEKVIEVLPPDKRDAIVLTALEYNRETLLGTHPALVLLRQCQHNWSEKLSRAILSRLHRQFTTARQNSDGHLLAAIQQFARYMPPSLIPDITESLQPLTVGYNAGTIHKVLDGLRFRYEMLQAFSIQKSPNPPIPANP